MLETEWICPHANEPKHKTRSKKSQLKAENSEANAIERRASRRMKYAAPLLLDWKSGWVTKENYYRAPGPTVLAPSEDNTHEESKQPKGAKLSSSSAPSTTTPTASGRRGKKSSAAIAAPGGAVSSSPLNTSSPYQSGHLLFSHSNSQTPKEASGKYFTSTPTPTLPNALSRVGGTPTLATMSPTPQYVHAAGLLAQQTQQANSPGFNIISPHQSHQSAHSAASTASAEFTAGFVAAMALHSSAKNHYFEAMLDADATTLVPSRAMLALASMRSESETNLDRDQLNAVMAFCTATGPSKENLWNDSRQRVSQAAAALLSEDIASISPATRNKVEEDILARSTALQGVSVLQTKAASDFNTDLLPGLRRLLGDSNLQVELLRFLGYQRLEQLYRFGHHVRTYQALKGETGVQGEMTEKKPGATSRRNATTEAVRNVILPGVPMIFPSTDAAHPIINHGATPLNMKEFSNAFSHLNSLVNPGTPSPPVIHQVAVAAQAQAQGHKLMFSPPLQTPNPTPQFGANFAPQFQATGFVPSPLSALSMNAQLQQQQLMQNQAHMIAAKNAHNAHAMRTPTAAAPTSSILGFSNTTPNISVSPMMHPGAVHLMGAVSNQIPSHLVAPSGSVIPTTDAFMSATSYQQPGLGTKKRSHSHLGEEDVLNSKTPKSAESTTPSRFPESPTPLHAYSPQFAPYLDRQSAQIVDLTSSGSVLPPTALHSAPHHYNASPATSNTHSTANLSSSGALTSSGSIANLSASGGVEGVPKGRLRVKLGGSAALRASQESLAANTAQTPPSVPVAVSMQSLAALFDQKFKDRGITDDATATAAQPAGGSTKNDGETQNSPTRPSNLATSSSSAATPSTSSLQQHFGANASQSASTINTIANVDAPSAQSTSINQNQANIATSSSHMDVDTPIPTTSANPMAEETSEISREKNSPISRNSATASSSHSASQPSRSLTSTSNGTPSATSSSASTALASSANPTTPVSRASRSNLSDTQSSETRDNLTSSAEGTLAPKTPISFSISPSSAPTVTSQLSLSSNSIVNKENMDDKEAEQPTPKEKGFATPAAISRKPSTNNVAAKEVSLPSTSAASPSVKATPQKSTSNLSTVSTPSSSTSSIVTPAATPQSEQATKALSSPTEKAPIPTVSYKTLKTPVLFSLEVRAKAQMVVASYWTPERKAILQALRSAPMDFFAPVISNFNGGKPHCLLASVLDADNIIVALPFDQETSSLGRDNRTLTMAELGGTKISRHHANLIHNAQKRTWVIEVLGKHGVRINDDPELHTVDAKVEVKDGDWIQIAATKFVLRVIN